MRTNKMKTALTLATTVALALTAVGCAHLESVSTTSIPPDRAKIVQEEASRFVFLGMNFDNDYVDGLTSGLAAQCPDGRVEGVLTKFESVTYFPGMTTMKVVASGFCVDPDAPRLASDAPVTSTDETQGGDR